jgi:hypothetical protein
MKTQVRYVNEEATLYTPSPYELELIRKIRMITLPDWDRGLSGRGVEYLVITMLHTRTSPRSPYNAFLCNMQAHTTTYPSRRLVMMPTNVSAQEEAVIEML